MRRVLWLAASLSLLAGCGGGDRLSSGDLPTAPARLHLSSGAFTEGSRLPPRYTCDGAGDEPLVQAGTVPPRTHELVLVVTDPDAPGGTFVHLTRFGISRRGDGSLTGGHEGRNSAGTTGWTSPCPPKSDAAHRYVWTAYALSDASGLSAGASPEQVTAALKGHGVLARGTITARYGR